MDDDLLAVSKVAHEAKQADGALVSATAAQRELYTAYDQAQFKDLPNVRDPKRLVRRLGRPNAPPSRSSPRKRKPN